MGFGIWDLGFLTMVLRYSSFCVHQPSDLAYPRCPAKEMGHAQGQKRGASLIRLLNRRHFHVTNFFGLIRSEISYLPQHHFSHYRPCCPGNGRGSPAGGCSRGPGAGNQAARNGTQVNLNVAKKGMKNITPTQPSPLRGGGLGWGGQKAPEVKSYDQRKNRYGPLNIGATTDFRKIFLHLLSQLTLAKGVLPEGL